MTANQETCDIRIGGDNRIGVFPRVPVRFLLQRALQDALGYTAADRRAMAERAEDDPPIEPSGTADEYAIPLCYYAVVGSCWPDRIEPTLRQCRHDVIEYGEAVFEHFLEADGVLNLADVRDEGLRLLREMLAGPTRRLTEEVETERGFTQGRAVNSTTG